MSAYSNLLGFYPTSKKQLDSILSQLKEDGEWPLSLPWQPIPVHTVPQSIDYVRISIADFFAQDIISLLRAVARL